MSDFFEILESVKIKSKDWSFSDLRINIGPMSKGSDASNPHTQYSNAVATFTYSGITAVGVTFTLGEGNQFICAAAKYIIESLNGKNLKELIYSPIGIAEILVNPLQLRWLSPNAGIPMMAAGLIMNTLLDFASKKADLPAWQFLAALEVEELLRLASIKHLKSSDKIFKDFKENFPSKEVIQLRVKELQECGIPAYFTTWIGSSAEEIINEIHQIHEDKGITSFKIKIGSEANIERKKLQDILARIPNGYSISVDANQKLNWRSALEWMDFLSHHGIVWLEEPFAPDNILLFRELKLKRKRNRWKTEIATGENCPNLHVAQALMEMGIDRFQADPCRMLGIVDGVFSGVLAKANGAEYTPHAGGAGLDELSPHLQLFNLVSVNPYKRIERTSTEHIGFCSKFYSNPTTVEKGRIIPPIEPGLLVGFSSSVTRKLIPYEDGVSWIEL